MAFLLLARHPRKRAATVFMVNVGIFLGLAAAAAAAHMYTWGANKESVAKYAIYGRYVEYFMIPLCVFALGVAELALPALRRRKKAIAAATALLTAVSIAVVPWSAFDKYLARDVMQVRHVEGIGWFLALRDGLGAWSLLPAMALAGFFAFALLDRRWESSVGWRRSIQISLALLAAMNAGLAYRDVLSRAQALERIRGECTKFISEHERAMPELEQIYLDFDFRDRARGRHQMLMIYVDHIDKVIMGTAPEEHLGEIPVVSRRDFPGLPVLCRDRAPSSGGLRLYGTQIIGRR